MERTAPGRRTLVNNWDVDGLLPEPPSRLSSVVVRTIQELMKVSNAPIYLRAPSHQARCLVADAL